MGDNSIIYLTFAMVFIWLVADCFIGKGYIKSFVNAIFEGGN